MSNTLTRIQNWYETNCNGDWEHTYGLKIGNIDNPGWSLKVDLEDSYLQNINFEECKYENEDENDWVHCRKENFKFIGYGGPQKLTELLQIFLEWAEDNEPKST